MFDCNLPTMSQVWQSPTSVFSSLPYRLCSICPLDWEEVCSSIISFKTNWSTGLSFIGHYTTAFFQAHLMLPLINSFMASSVYIIICMTVNRYISIYKPTDFQRLHTQKNARVSISLSFFFGIIFHIPLCFQNKVVKYCGAPGKLFHFLFSSI